MLDVADLSAPLLQRLLWRGDDLPAHKSEQMNDAKPDQSFIGECMTNRRFWTLVPVVICINMGLYAWERSLIDRLGGRLMLTPRAIPPA